MHRTHPHLIHLYPVCVFKSYACYAYVNSSYAYYAHAYPDRRIVFTHADAIYVFSVSTMRSHTHACHTHLRLCLFAVAETHFAFLIFWPPGVFDNMALFKAYSNLSSIQTISFYFLIRLTLFLVYTYACANQIGLSLFLWYVLFAPLIFNVQFSLVMEII